MHAGGGLMNTDPTTQAAFMDDLYTALSVRAALAEVYVVSVPVDPLKTPKPDTIMFIGTFQDEDTLTTTGGVAQERYELQGVVTVIRPGAGQEAGKASRDRAMEILREVRQVIRETMQIGADRLGGTAFYRLARISISQAFATAGHLTAVEFTVSVTAQLHDV